MRTWWNSRHVGPRSRWAKAHEGAIPSVRTNLSRRGWNVDTAGSNPAGRHCPCRCDSGRRDHLCGRAWNSRPGGLKNRRARRRVSVQVAPAAPNFSASGGTDTRESQKLVGESPCRCESCLADQFSSLALGALPRHAPVPARARLLPGRLERSGVRDHAEARPRSGGARS